MQISEERVDQFMKLYRKHYGQEISREGAYRLGMHLVTVMDAVYKPIPKKAIPPKD